MVLLRNNIYCKSSVLSYAIGSSSKTTHFVRKLILGVYKKEIFKKGSIEVTLTGRAPRTSEKQRETKYCNIDPVAKATIIGTFFLSYLLHYTFLFFYLDTCYRI